MRICVNGRWQDQPQETTVSGLLAGMGLEPRRLAVELNKRIVPRASFCLTRLAENDQLEIVTLVGGG